MSTLSKNLEKLIKQKGLSNRSVSITAGKNQQLVADIIKGRTRSPSIETLNALAKALKVPVSQITGDKVSDKPDLEILGACMLWVLKNADHLAFLSHERIVEELMKQYSQLLNGRINDKIEAVRITRNLFETIHAQELPIVENTKVTKSDPRRNAKKN